MHGVNGKDLSAIRSSFSTKENWIKGWADLAETKTSEADEYMEKKSYKQAELTYRSASLYFQLVQWLIPERTQEKRQWLQKSMKVFKKADEISTVPTRYETIRLGDHNLIGRLRLPANPKGVIIMINPMDSAKEELFKYELDFVERQFTTINFDGPGQGETFTFQNLKGSEENWKQYVDHLIEYASLCFPQLPIFLFGTSSGASWAIYGSCNQKVSKVAAVSPAFAHEEIRMPDYFIERTHYVMEKDEISLPVFKNLLFRKPVFLIHGQQDIMVSNKNIYKLYEQLPDGKRLLEYEDEGHCCNFKLQEIRQNVMNWFEEK